MPRTRHKAGARRSRRISPRLWIAAAVGAASLLLGGLVILVRTEHGTIQIELSDPAAKVEVKVDGDIVSINGLDEPLQLKVGEHALVVTGARFETVTKSFTVKKGSNPVLQVSLVEKPPAVAKTTVDTRESIKSDPETTSKKTERTPATTTDAREPTTAGEVRRFDGHTDTVWCVAFSGDGRQLWSGSRDGTVRIWDRDTGATVRQIDLRAGGITRVAFAADFHAVVTSHFPDKFVQVWNTESGQEVRRLQGHASPVWSTGLSPDSRRALAGAEDGAVRLWNVNTGNEIGRFDGHTGLVQSVVFSPDGRRALSGSQDKLVCLWDLDTGKRLQTLAGHTGKVCSLAFSSDGRHAVSGGGGVDARGQPADCSVHVWDLESGQELQCLRGHTNGVTGVAFTPDARRVISASYDTTVRIWDVQTGKELHRFEGHAKALECVAVSPDGRFAVSGGIDKVVRLWRLPAPETAAASSSVPAPGWVSLFNGEDLTGWRKTGMAAGWSVQNGEIVAEAGQQGGNFGWLMTEKDYSDFELQLEFATAQGTDSGVAFRCDPDNTYPTSQAEIQIVDEQDAEMVRKLDQGPYRRTGALAGQSAVRTVPSLERGRWHTMTLELRDRQLKVTIDATVTVDTNLNQHVEQGQKMNRRGIWQPSGPIGLQKMLGIVRFRNIRIRELSGGIVGAPRSRPELVALHELPFDQHKSSPWPSPDGLTLYWCSKGADQRIWVATRMDTASPFGGAKELFAGDDLTVADDGLEMIFNGGKARGGRLHVCTRASTKDDWGPPRKLNEFEGLGFIAAPCLIGDGLTLYAEQLGDKRPNVRFRRPNRQAPWGKAEPMTITGLPATNVRFPFVTAGSRLLFGCSEGMRLFTSTDGGKTFGNPVLIDVPGGTVMGKFPRYVPATRELFFSGDVAGQGRNDIYVIRNFDPGSMTKPSNEVAELPPSRPDSARSAPSGPPLAEVAMEMQKLNGLWKFVKGELNGKEITGQFADQRQMLLTDGTYVQKFGGNTIEGTYQIDPTKRPKTIDFTPLRGGGSEAQGKPQLGIYELDGDMFRYCVSAAGDPRPTEFTTNKPKQSLQAYVREKLSRPASTRPELVRLDELNTAGLDWFPWVTPDGLTIYWEGPEAGSPTSWIWTASRKDADSPFENKTRLLRGRHPTATADGLQVIFVNQTDDTQKNKTLHIATRSSRAQPFGAPRQIAELRPGTPTEHRQMPAISPDGLTLYFHIADGGGFWFATRSSLNAAWGAAQRLPMVLDRLPDHKITWPFLTRDQRTLYCAHEGDVGQGRFMVWSRASTAAPFADFKYLEVPNVPDLFGRPVRYIEATDELFFSSTRPRGQNDWNLWVIKNFSLDR